MIKIKQLASFIIFFFFSFMVSGQMKSLKGKVVAKDDVDGIHILNKTALKFTVTDTDGTFAIPAKLLDTITVSGLKYKTQEIVVTKSKIDSGFLVVNLEENINLLDEVVVGKILTGSLESDANNVAIKREINFYDLGVPGYTGKMPTQSQRRLIEATTGAGLLPLNTILNAISGRTKRLKKNIKFEANNKCIKQLREQYAEILFEKESLPDSLKTEYFYFCLDDENINSICHSTNPLKQVEFLQKKLKVYKANLATRDEED